MRLEGGFLECFTTLPQLFYAAESGKKSDPFRCLAFCVCVCVYKGTAIPMTIENGNYKVPLPLPSRGTVPIHLRSCTEMLG
jgi:hypothetical protein